MIATFKEVNLKESTDSITTERLSHILRPNWPAFWKYKKNSPATVENDWDKKEPFIRLR